MCCSIHINHKYFLFTNTYKQKIFQNSGNYSKQNSALIHLLADKMQIRSEVFEIDKQSSKTFLSAYILVCFVYNYKLLFKVINKYN